MTIYIPAITVKDRWFEETYFLPWCKTKDRATKAGEKYISEQKTRNYESLTLKVIEVPYDKDTEF